MLWMMREEGEMMREEEHHHLLGCFYSKKGLCDVALRSLFDGENQLQ